MKPYIAVGLSFFEDATCLSNCLDSVLQDEVLRRYIKVIAVDGRYKGYPIDHDLSEDGSREIIEDYRERFPENVSLWDYPNLHERFKRQKYVDIAARESIPYLLILDSDEWIEVARVDKLIKELKHIEEEWYDTNIENPIPVMRVGNVCNVKCIDRGEDNIPFHMVPRPRLWYRPQDMHYTTKHYWFARKEDIPDPNKTDSGNINYRQDNNAMIFNSKYQTSYIRHIVIHHSHQNRTEDREKRRIVYEFERLPKLEGSAKLGIFDKENILK